MGWNGDASAKIPAGGISTLKPISAFEITQNLNQGFNYEFVYGEIGPEGTPYGRQGLTEGMRAFLQRAALS